MRQEFYKYYDGLNKDAAKPQNKSVHNFFFSSADFYHLDPSYKKNDHNIRPFAFVVPGFHVFQYIRGCDAAFLSSDAGLAANVSMTLTELSVFMKKQELDLQLRTEKEKEEGERV